MGAQTDRLRCEVCQNLFLSPINTGLLRYAVATALTVYGIETREVQFTDAWDISMLQQPLPFTVLKPLSKKHNGSNTVVATALTVYGIETNTNGSNTDIFDGMLQQPLPFTVLKRPIGLSLTC